MPRQVAGEWNRCIDSLNFAGIRCTDRMGDIRWTGNNATGIITARSAYEYIIKRRCLFPSHWWYKLIWQWHLPLKLQCFLWFALVNRLKTWDNLKMCGWIGPSRCVLCRMESETATHLFVDCGFIKNIWGKFTSYLGLTHHWEGCNVEKCLYDWVRFEKAHFTLPVFICWVIWRAQNIALFDNYIPIVDSGFHEALSLYLKYQEEDRKLVERNISNFQLTVDDPILFFDGATAEGKCGIGGVIYLNYDHFYTICMHGGVGTNTKAELLALWCVVKASICFGLHKAKIFGDSRVAIKWAHGEYDL